jgi:hypothetical protein
VVSLWVIGLPPATASSSLHDGGTSKLQGLAEEVPAPTEDAEYVWRKSDEDRGLMLRVTRLGLSRIDEVETSRSRRQRS